MSFIIYILSGLLLIAAGVILGLRIRPKNIVIDKDHAIIFKDDDDTDWVIKKHEGKIITGVLQGGIIIKKSTI